MSQEVFDESVAAVVVTFNRAHVLTQCLESLIAQTRPIDHIVVVDNGGEGDGARVVGERFPSVEVIRLEANVGPEAAFAIAIGKLGDGFTWFWGFDDDSVLVPSALERLLAVARQYGVAGLAITLGGVLRSGMPVHGGARARLTGKLRRVDFSVIDGSLIRWDAIKSAGPPRSDLFIMMADVEFMSRIAAQEGGLVVTDEPLIRRLQMGGTAAGGFSPAWRDYYLARNQVLLGREGWAGGSVTRATLWNAKLALACALRPKRHGRKALSLSWGLIDGLRGVRGRTVDPMSN